MAGATHSVPTEGQPLAAANRLDSWKEIAVYLKRSVRTVRRWEAEQNLPIHRHAHQASCTVYAFKSELDKWWANRRDDLEPESESNAAQLVEGLPECDSRSTFRRWPIVTLVGVLALLAFVVVRWIRYPRSSSTSRAMLLVLPFEDLGPDPEQEYLNDGLTEETITQLGKLDPERLGVIARTSAMRYKGTPVGLDQIRKELHVDYVLEGSIRQEGGRARITAQLIRVNDQTHLWAESYDRNMNDLLAVQDEIAQAITHSVQIKVTPETKMQLARAAAVSPEAHDAYLMGRYLWNRRTPEALSQAIAHFEQAVRIDPNYALAYAGLADCYVVLPTYTNAMAGDAFAKAEQAARKALQIDPALAEAYVSLAGVDMDSWKWADAVTDFHHAIELAANNATAHQWYAGYLQEIGHLDQAMIELRKAQALDPFSVSLNKAMVHQLYIQRQYDAALALSGKVVEMEPSLPGFHNDIGLIYQAKGLLPQAAAQFRRAAAISRDDPWSIMYLGNLQASSGKAEQARAALRKLKILSKRRHVSPFYFGIIRISLGEKDRGFELLNKAIDEHDDSITWTKSSPAFDGLRTDARYGFLLKRINFPR